MTKVLLFLFLSVLIACDSPVKKPDNEPSLSHSMQDSLTKKLTTLHQLGRINGFGVAIVDQDRILYENGVGYSDESLKNPYNINTLQNIGSVSKTMIGIALLKAVELGKLDLDDPINKYLTFPVQNPYFPEIPITIRHLSTHTSTILDTDDYDSKVYILKDSTSLDQLESAELNEKFNPPSEALTNKEFLEKMLSAKGDWYKKENFSKNKPGEFFEYSNIGAALAAAVIENAVAMSYRDFTTKHILNPLNMHTSAWSLDSINLREHSKLYANTETEIPFYSLITYPDGGMITNVHELGLYLIELINGYQGTGNLLQTSSYAELFKVQLASGQFTDRDEEDDYDDEYNTGIFMGYSPKGYVGHRGGDPGIATFMFFNPKTKIGRILMINTSIVDAKGEEQFYAIWNTLGEYEQKFH